jgi:hypothetical protein|eukprot:4188596-Prymnesium_polylepis.1
MKRLMSSEAEDEAPAERKRVDVIAALGAFADASWDMFVMPGEAANSRYDRPIEPTESPPESSAFDWGGDKDEAALRLPKGVKAAERLAPQTPRPRPGGSRLMRTASAGAWLRTGNIEAAF